MHTREIAAYGGLVNRMPLYAVVLHGLHAGQRRAAGHRGFVGEFLTLLGAFKANTWVAFLAATGVILSAAYALYLYRRVIFGALEKPSLQDIADLSYREVAGVRAAGAADDLLRLLSGAAPRRDGGVGQEARRQLRDGHHARPAAQRSTCASAERTLSADGSEPPAGPTRRASAGG